MSKIYLNIDDVKKYSIPHLENSIKELNNAIKLTSSLNKYNSLNNSYIKNLSYNLVNKKEECNKILKWLSSSLESYSTFNEESKNFIDKCLVSKINDKSSLDDESNN